MGAPSTPGRRRVASTARIGEDGKGRLTRTWLSSPPVARRYACAAKAALSCGRAFLKGSGWKSHVEMGLLSCHRISRVRKRMVVLVRVYQRFAGAAGLVIAALFSSFWAVSLWLPHKG